MRKTSFLMDSRFRVSLLIISSIFVFASFFAYADTGTFYSCVDKEGKEALSNYPVDGKTCKQIGLFEGMTKEESENYSKDREKKRTEEYEKMIAAEKKAAEERAKRAEEEAKEKRLRDLEARTAAAEKAAENAEKAAGNAAWAAQEAAAAAARNRRRP